MKKLTKEIKFNHEGNLGFVCPNCKSVRDLHFQADIILDNSFKDVNIIPNITFDITCKICNCKFQVSIEDGVDAAIANAIAILEEKGYFVEDTIFNDSKFGTVITFKDKLPNEAIEMLDCNWEVSNSTSGANVISICKGNINERAQFLSSWVTKLPKRNNSSL